MLQLWSKPSTITLTPEGIAFQSAKGDVRLLTAETTLRSWESLLAELPGLGSTINVRHIRFVLSNQFVRYAVLPWQVGVLSSLDWQALGEHHLRKLYGGIAETWEVRVALHGYGESVVICAIDRGLVSRLEEISTTFGWTLHAIEPALMAVFNHYQRQIPPDCWLLLAEPQRLLLAETSGGQWKRFTVASPRVGSEREECLAMVERAVVEQSANDSGDRKQSPLVFFGPVALLPKTIPESIRIMRLSQALGSEAASSLTMLAAL